MRHDAMTTPETPPPMGAVSRKPFSHAPVLLEAVLSLVPQGAKLLVDATLGGGGHAEALLKSFPEAELFGCDRDPEALLASKERLVGFGQQILLKHLSFSDLPRHLMAESVDFLLADLGVSSPQLDHAERGFSFSADGPLDMRMDPASGLSTAAELINHAPREQLLEIFYRLGEERFSARVVNAILEARAEDPLLTTGRLATLVARAVPARHHRKGRHPATKIFQALRLAVNDELGQLEALLENAPAMLKPGGRMAVISFHSLEDRAVKNRFRLWEQPCECPPKLPLCICGKVPLGKRLTRKPVLPSEEEAAQNPRSRSAKMRAFEKSA